MELTNTYRVMDEFAKRFITLYKTNLENNNHIANGSLINSLRYFVQKDENTIEVDIELQDYWKYIENGTRPHFPPMDAILGWIRIKPILPQPINGKLPTEKQLAYLISRKISQVGTKGTNDLSNALEDTMTEFENRIEQAVYDDIDSVVGTMLLETFI